MNAAMIQNVGLLVSIGLRPNTVIIIGNIMKITVLWVLLYVKNLS